MGPTGSMILLIFSDFSAVGQHSEVTKSKVPSRPNL